MKYKPWLVCMDALQRLAVFIPLGGHLGNARAVQEDGPVLQRHVVFLELRVSSSVAVTLPGKGHDLPVSGSFDMSGREQQK